MTGASSWSGCGRLTRAALVTSALLMFGTVSASIDTARADQFIDAGGGWQTYVNERFGTRVTFPADIFTPGEQPENRDGRRFDGGDAALEVFAWENLDGETANSLKRRLVGTEGYTEVTYSPSGPNWLVLSGYRGDDIFYEKYFFRDETIHGFGMEFPRSERPFYAPIVEDIEDSFRAG